MREPNMLGPRLLVLPLVAILVTASFASNAEAQGQDNPEARAAFDEGARQFEAHNYALALQHFTSAYDQLVAVGYARAAYLLYNIGRCNEELGRLPAARDAFQRFLAEADQEAPFRAEVGDRIQELQARIDASGGDSGGGGSLSWIGWSLVGLGGAAAIGGVITGVMALDRGDQLAARCPDFACTDPNDSALIDEAETLAVVTDVLIVSGVVVAAGGVVLALVLDLSADSPTPSAGCWGDGCQVGVSGRF